MRRTCTAWVLGVCALAALESCCCALAVEHALLAEAQGRARAQACSDCRAVSPAAGVVPRLHLLVVVPGEPTCRSPHSSSCRSGGSCCSQKTAECPQNACHPHTAHSVAASMQQTKLAQACRAIPIKPASTHNVPCEMSMHAHRPTTSQPTPTYHTHWKRAQGASWLCSRVSSTQMMASAPPAAVGCRKQLVDMPSKSCAGAAEAVNASQARSPIRGRRKAHAHRRTQTQTSWRQKVTNQSTLLARQAKQEEQLQQAHVSPQNCGPMHTSAP